MRARDPADSSRTMPFLQHLEELRRAVLGSLGALVVGMGLAIPFAPRVFRILQRPLTTLTGDAEPFLRTLDVSGGFTLAMQLVFWTGLLISLPVILYFIGGFISPGLTPRERRLAGRAVIVAAGLFVLGVWIGYTVSLPIALKVMLQTNVWLGIRAEWIVSSYIVFTLQLLVAFGLVFELPVLLTALGWMGLVSSARLRAARRVVIVVILVIAMILTPPDVFTQLIMAIPLILLYEVCIVLIRIAESRRAR